MEFNCRILHPKQEDKEEDKEEEEEDKEEEKGKRQKETTLVRTVPVVLKSALSY